MIQFTSNHAKGAAMIEEMAAHAARNSLRNAQLLRHSLQNRDLSGFVPVFCQVHGWHPAGCSPCKPRRLTKTQQLKRRDAMSRMLTASGSPSTEIESVLHRLTAVDAAVEDQTPKLAGSSLQDAQEAA